MPFAALLMMTVVLSIMTPATVIAILWPAAVARVNAAALRTLPVAATRRSREQAASNSTPAMMRFVGVVGLVIMLVLGTTATRTVLERGIDGVDTPAPAWMLWTIYALGVGQAVFGIILVIRSRPIFERLRRAFEEEGAALRRWMIALLGGVGLVIAATTLYIAVTLS